MEKGDVLNELLHNERLTASKLAAILNTRTGVICNMKKRGLSKTYATKIKKLYPKYSLQWLLTGEGNMYENNGENIIQDMKSDVINELLYNERINSTQLAALINASLQSISSMKKRGLSKTYATKIKELYPKYSLHWLLTGEGSMYENNGDNIIQCAGNATNNTQNSNEVNKELLGELIAQRKMFEEQINRLIGLLERK